MQPALQAWRDPGAAGGMLVGEPGYCWRFGFCHGPQLVYPGIPPEHFVVLPFTNALPQGTVTFHRLPRNGGVSLAGGAGASAWRGKARALPLRPACGS